MPCRFVSSSSQWINLGTNQPYLQSCSGSTMMAWVNLPDLTPSSSYHIGAISVASLLSTNLSRISLQVNGAGSILMVGRSSDSDSEQNVTTSTGVLAANTWYHIVGVNNYVSKTQSIYVNGQLIITRTGVTGFSATTTGSGASRNSAIAAQDDGGGEYFNGEIHDFRVYRRAVSATDILNIYETRGKDKMFDSDLEIRYILSEGPVGATIGIGGAAQLAITGVTTGSITTYSVSDASNLWNGSRVTITGMNPSTFNLVNVVITSITSTTFVVANILSGSFVSGGIAMVQSSIPNLGQMSTYATQINNPTYTAGILRIP